MAEKETKNKPKDLIEAVPEEVENLVLDVPEIEKPVEKEKYESKKDTLSSWIPKTKLGISVKEGKEKDIDKILDKGKKILEPEIVDYLLSVESNLLLIGQAKGKFGGGKRRAWRQTQKKTKEGNILTFSTMVVVGDKNSHVGLGYGRAKETLPAREKALRHAKLSLTKIQRGFEDPADTAKSDPHTVPFKVEGKCGSVRITLLPAPRGTGLAVADECKKILKLAGIKDVYSRATGQTRTTFNLARACMDALSKTNKMIR
ncbi:MAG: 30S ribosomal protein S5 [Nanoarchaeota archaeon]|nr:30S ribosomal protein S5 [Nanoarchaeota archaeon]